MLTVSCITLFSLCLYCPLFTRAQRPPVTNDSYRHWTRLSTAYALRDDGQYLWYQYGSPASGDILVLRTVDDRFHREFPRGFNPAFADKRFLFQVPGDTLGIISADSITYLPGVTYYTIRSDQLILQKNNALVWMDLRTGRIHTVFSHSVNQLTFNGRQLAFISGQTLRHYQAGMDTAQILHDNCTGPLHFSRDGTRIFFQLLPAKPTPPPPIKIWDYRDRYIQGPPLTSTTAVIGLQDKHVVVLNASGTQIAYQDGGRYIITQNSLNHQEYYWNKSVISTLYLVDTYTGERKKIAANKDMLLLQAAISPKERFVTWYDAKKKSIYSYEIATGLVRPLLKGNSVAQWAAGDSVLYIHSEYDVWQVDPTGSKAPANMTHGKQRKIIFRWLFPGIFSAFDTKTKQNGFWKWDNGMLVRRTLHDCLYYMPLYPLDQYKPVKARDTNIYLLQRMTAKKAPELLLTKDFSTFTPLTLIQPQSAYNWMSVQLTPHGLLYKPEDFDPRKKYPVIFHYYERSKDYLHRYLAPALSEGSLNIAWYVSNGYIVFVPEIRTKKGHPGSSAAKAVIRAARYLSAFPWVDKQHMGLQGHSFGGYITHAVITHTDLFAAAQSSAGPVNFFSGYGAIRKITGTAMQQLYEQGQNNMGATPWDRPRLYLKNSPVIYANRVHTPLLMMHNDNDNAVPFAQGMELFTALRRLQRPVWLIQYKNEGHQLFQDPDKLDFTIRQQQFFDHYLKGKLLPEWMKGH